MKSIFLFLCVLVFSVFTHSNNLFAKDIKNNMENNISKINQEMELNKNKKSDYSRSSEQDIFGDEQTFPFVAGLGKNAAH